MFSELVGYGIQSDMEKTGDAQRNLYDQCALRLLGESYSRALKILDENKELIHSLVRKLRECETLDKNQFIEVVRSHRG
jgi:ATP-dependent Zn protease